VIEKRTNDVRELAEEIIGQVSDVIHQPYGHGGITFEVRCASGEFILKTREERGSFDHTEHHIEVLKDLGILVPSVMRRGSFRGFEYLLLAKIPGRDLGHCLADMTRPQMTKLADQIVKIEKMAGSLPKGAGYGWTPMDVSGPFPSWTSVIERDSQSAPSEVHKMVTEWKTYFDSVPPTCFLDDLTVKNVVMQDGELQGIVDLDFVCYGDPLYWLSLAEVTVVLDVGIQSSFYGDELRRLWGMTKDTAAVCDLYNAIQAWFFLSKDTRNVSLELWTARRLRRCQGILDSM